MSNLQQNYDFNYQQPTNNQPDNSEDEKVRKLRIIWIILVAIPTILLHIAGFVMDFIGVDSILSNNPEMDTIIGAIMCVVPGSFVVAHHIVAIVGKIKYRNNKKMNDIFIADMVMLAGLVAFFLFIAALDLACDMMCGDCG
ncbi:MAG: hypothetical protein IJI47_04290 [Eubacterium sp.]|nr:hypothetical protein [Eubacterium sp.]MBR0412767.1 hypothetical protein [Eubacterium sp.]